MRYLAAYLLTQMGGNSRPQEEDIKNILGSVGVECETERVQKLIQEMHGKNVNELIAEGRSKMASLSFGAAAAAPAAAAPGAAPAAAAPEAPKGGEKAAPAKEEKKEESEESDADMGFSLFD